MAKVQEELSSLSSSFATTSSSAPCARFCSLYSRTPHLDPHIHMIQTVHSQPVIADHRAGQHGLLTSIHKDRGEVGHVEGLQAELERASIAEGSSPVAQ